MLAGSPADPFLEGRGEHKGVLITHFDGDGLDLLIRRRQQLSGASHPQISDLPHGGTAQLLGAESAQVLLAHVSGLGQFMECPLLVQVLGDLFPEQGQALVHSPRLSEAEDVSLNEFHPVMHGGRGGRSIGVPPVGRTGILPVT